MLKNIVIRSLSGLVFMGLMIGGILYHPLCYAILMVLITGIMMWEYFRMTLGKQHQAGQIISIATGTLLFLLTYASLRFQMPFKWFFVLVFPVTALWISLIYQKKDSLFDVALYLFAPLLYIALPWSLTNLLVFDSMAAFSGKLLLSLFIILWASDVGAYVFGVSFGQKNGHKLFPRLSPKKSWEGFFGGLLSALAAGYLLSLFLLPFSLIHCLIIALLLHVFGVFGDLIESQIKRHFNVKDSGQIMPGHGGLLDRFDSSIVAFPVIIAYIQLFSI